MVKKQVLQDRYKLKTDDELLEIVGEMRNQYEASAVQIAEEELNQRGIFFEVPEVSTKKEDDDALNMTDNETISENDIEWFERVKYSEHIVLPFMIGVLILTSSLALKGVELEPHIFIILQSSFRLLSVIIVLLITIKWKAKSLEIVAYSCLSFVFPWISLMAFAIQFGSKYSRLKNRV
jgi:hypothetical protein